MRIASIDVTPFNLPLRRPISFARGVLAVTEHVLVEIRTDQGIVGRAEAPSRPFFYGESQQSMVAAVKRWFAPLLVGADPFNVEAAWEALDRVEHNNTIKGAIDIALHDIMGQAARLPCVKLLGGYGDSVRVTYVCGAGSAEAIAEEALAQKEAHGIAAFKLKVGVYPAEDAAMLKHIRTALPDALLYVDGNQAFDRHGALRMLAACAEHGIAWAEEPCAASNRSGRMRVGADSPVPILGDESCRTLDEVAREIEDGAVQLVSIKAARTGFRLSRNILAHCLAKGIRPMSGSQGDSAIGVLAGAHFCAAHRQTHALPGELCFHLNLADDLLAEPPEIEHGRLRLPAEPGLGIAIDPDKLKRFRVDL